MSEPQDAGRMLEMAQQAASAGDLASAEELLRGAARIQEAELGPLHPDLANTLNNLAIVAEKTGQLGDAETCYRRAVAIAAASLPADHPMIAASRENLEDFCRAHGLPIAAPAFTMPSALETASALDAFAPEAAADAAEMPADVRAAEAALTTQATPPPSGSPSPVSRPTTPTASEPPPASRRVSRSLAWAAVGVVVILVTATFLVRGSWSSRDTSTPAPTAEPAAPQAAERVQPPRAEPPAVQGSLEQKRSPTVVRQGDDRDVPTGKPAARSSPSGAITLATAQLCQTFSTSGASWRCDPASPSVSPGRMVLYTRVRSPWDAVVVHRWYRGDTLQQSVRLTVRANATEGYRTYSRQTVDRGDWRVEVRSAEGHVLHERRFTVR